MLRRHGSSRNFGDVVACCQAFFFTTESVTAGVHRAVRGNEQAVLFSFTRLVRDL